MLEIGGAAVNLEIRELRFEASCKPASSLATKAKLNPALARPRALSKPRPRLAPVTTASGLVGSACGDIVGLCRTCTTTAYARSPEKAIQKCWGSVGR